MSHFSYYPKYTKNDGLSQSDLYQSLEFFVADRVRAMTKWLRFSNWRLPEECLSPNRHAYSYSFRLVHLF